MHLHISKRILITTIISIFGIILFSLPINYSPIIGCIPASSQVQDLEVGEDFTYLAFKGLLIVDTSDPSHPQIIGNISNINPQWISLQDKFIFLEGGDHDLTIIDVSNPYNASIIEVLEDGGIAVSQGNFLYSIRSADLIGSRRFCVYNFSNPEHLTLISERSWANRGARDFKIKGDYGYIIGGEDLMTIVNLSDILDVKIVSTYYETNISSYSGQNLQIHNNIAYITNYRNSPSELRRHDLYAINVSDPTSPELMWKIDSEDIVNIWVESNFLYCTSPTMGLIVYDISNPYDPILFDRYTYHTYSVFNGVEVHKNKIYIAGAPHLLILDNTILGQFSRISFQSIILPSLFLFMFVSCGILSIIFLIYDLYSSKRMKRTQFIIDFY